MSGTIDERVVAMKFNNSQFQSGVKSTLDSLSALKNGLNLDASKKSLENLNDAGKNFSLANVSSSVDGLSGKFVALATIGVTALSKITSKAIDTGAQLIKSLTLDPLKSGLEEYETNLNAIQTILANTQSKGTGLADVNESLQELNLYSDKTIYNFSEMARNIGTFTAAGVSLDASTNAIKGIANLAAMSGSNAQQASTAMYQLSQALATGRVSLMDWNSVVNAGMGGQVFQDALKETARVHGVAVDQIIKDEGSFRDSLQKGWLTSDILTETLSKFTGDLNADQLRTMGYTEDQIAGILKMAATASDAATKVKTMSQLIGTLKESAQSGWAQSWQIVAGDFEEARTMWTNVNNVLGGMISASAQARNDLLQGWKDLGGRDVFLESFKNAFDALMRVISPIKEAFREIFPPMTAQRLFDMTKAIRDFTERLKISAETSATIKRIFKGVFALFDIGMQIIKGVVGVFKDLFGQFSGAGSSILDASASVGDFLVSLNETLKKGDSLTNFFKKFSDVLRKPIELLKTLSQWLRDAFSDASTVAVDGASSALERMRERLAPLGAIGDVIANVWSHLGDIFAKVWVMFKPLAEKMSEFFGEIGQRIQDSIKNMDFDKVLDGVNTGLLAGLVLLVKKFLSNGINFDIGGGLIDSIKDVFGGLTGTLTAMQNQLRADALMKIAGAVAVLAASVVVLSLIDSAKLTTALAAMTAMFVQLFASMAIFEKISAGGGFLKMPLVASSMILLSVAIGILALAVEGLSDMSWEELAKGLSGVTALLGVLAGAAYVLSLNAGGLLGAGFGIIGIAFAVRLLYGAVKDFAGMEWADLGKGLAGMAGALAVTVGALALITPASLVSAAGVLVIAAALEIIADVMRKMGAMEWEEIGKSLVELVGSLAIIAGAMYLMEAALPAAAALIIIAASLVVMTDALKDMGKMEWEEIGKSMVVLAGSLLIISGAMFLMEAALPGAAALIVVAGALAILAPVLKQLGRMSWDEIVHGLVALAGVFAVIGLAGLLLAPVVPALIGIAAALAILGVAILAAGVGVLAFSTGIAALNVALGTGSVAIVAFISSIIAMIPQVIKAIGEGIILFAGVVAESGPQLVAAMVTLIESLLTAINDTAPKIIDTFMALIGKLLQALVDNMPNFVQKGMDLISSFLQGIGNNVQRLVDGGIYIVSQVIIGIGKGALTIAKVAMLVLINFLNGLADAIEQNTDAVINAGKRVGYAIVRGILKALGEGAGMIIKFVMSIGTSALEGIKSVLGIHSPSKEFYAVGKYMVLGTIMALKDGEQGVVDASANLGVSALDSLKTSLSKINDAVYSNVDTTPVIRPVLDLSDIQKNAQKLDSLTGDPRLVTISAWKTAQSIASIKANGQLEDNSIGNGAVISKPISFTQNNYSPRALSTIDIYRQTKNQISTARGV